MAEVATFRKNKIDLKEYDYSKDIHNRVLMAQFTTFDVEILEEILYSSLRIPVSVLQKNLDVEEKTLSQALDRLSQTGLFQVVADHVIVDKEMRKYYELQILKFEEDFKPGMEYLQGLLRKVPIHILPNWYSIARSSNNIFESIVEKHLATPQIYKRYLMDLYLSDPVQNGILNALFQSPEYEVDAAEMIHQFDLTQEEFEEHMLFLEFSFIGCVKFVREESGFKQVISPFQEWKEYLCHLRDTEPTSVIDEEHIKRVKASDFSIVEEMSAVLEFAKIEPVTKAIIPSIQKQYPEFDEEDFSYYVEKLCALNLADHEGEQIVCTSDSLEWLKMDLTDRALYLYRHPLNYLEDPDLPEELCQHRFLREAEKCLSRTVNIGWIFIDDFIRAIFIPLKEEHTIKLIRQGRTWKYQLPEYSEKEISFFKAVIQNWLFELGITALGTLEGQECFTLTPFGQGLFSDE